MVRTYRRPLRLHVPKTLFRNGFYGFNHFRSGQRTACVCVCVCVCVNLHLRVVYAYVWTHQCIVFTQREPNGVAGRICACQNP